MDQKKYEGLVRRLERAAEENPGKYLRTVMAVAFIAVAIIGIAICSALLPAAALVGIVFFGVVSSGKLLFLLAKLGKLVYLLALPAWTMLKSSGSMLFSRFPMPEGRELLPREAPALFGRINKLQRQMAGPPVHTVLLSDELNAAIVQHPRLGLFGWERNYLILGFPLLQVLTEEEALAVVAHEYGHLSGHHSRLGGFIYRFRAAWGRAQSLADQWEGRFSRLIARLFGWYAPYFNAYTFVLARKNEYSADLASVEVAGRDNAANALMRINVMARFQDEIFWPAILRRIAAEPEPPTSRTAFWTESVNNLLDEEARARLLDAGRREITGYLDTHPSLGDRLAAMGAAADRDASSGLKLPAISAAASWLGESLPAIRDEFDATWREEIGETWRTKHAYLQERRDRLAQLDEETPDPAEQWERLSIIAEVQPEVDLVPLLDLFLKRFPDHLPARFRRGTLLLERGIEAGVGDVEAVMTADADAVIPGCEVAWQFYREKDPEKAEGYRTRWEERSDYVRRVEAELQTLSADAVLAPAELDEETLANIRRILQRHRKQFRRVWVLRRILKADRNVSDHLIAFETGRFFMVDNGPEVAKRLAAEEFPLRMFIVHLGSRPYKKFRRTISEMRLEPLAL